MDGNSFLWAAGIITLTIFVQRTILSLIAHWKSHKQYDEEISEVLNGEEYKVKGRFE